MTTSHDPFTDRATRAATAVRESAETTDLEALLERIEDAHVRPWWFVPALVAGAAAATITAILAVPSILSSDPTPVVEPVAPERTSGATERPAVGGATGWFEPVATFPGSSTVLVELPSGELLSLGNADDGSPVVRRSSDGAGWDAVTTDLPPDDVRPVDATVVDGEVWMVAESASGPLGFVSRDGVTWEPAAFSPAPGPVSSTQLVLTAVTGHGDQVVALGHDRDGAFVALLSRASSSLALEPPARLPEASSTTALDVASDGDTLILLAFHPSGEGTRALVTRGPLTGATRWDQRAMVTGFQPSGSIEASTEGFLVPGTQASADGAPGWLVTIDGVRWRSSVVRDAFEGPMYVDALAVADGLVVGLGRDFRSDPPGLLEIAGSVDVQSLSLGSSKVWVDAGARRGEPARVDVLAARAGTFGTVTQTDETGVTTTTVFQHGRSERAPSPDPAATDRPTAACEPATVDGAASSVAGLSAEARETYDRIATAAAACDLAELAAIADEGEPVLVSFGDIYLDEAWLTSDRQWLRPHDDPHGNPNIVDILRRTLAMSTAVQDTGDGMTIHSWPAAFVEMTPERRRELLDSGLYSEEELDRYDEFGGFAGWRVGVTDDGDWIFFIAGD